MTKGERLRIYQGWVAVWGREEADRLRAKAASEARAEGQRRRMDNKRSAPRPADDFSVKEVRAAAPKSWVIKSHQVKGLKTGGGWGGRWTAVNETHSLEAESGYALVMMMYEVGCDIRARVGIDVETGEVDIYRNVGGQLPDIL